MLPRRSHQCCLVSKVFDDYNTFIDSAGPVTKLDTPTFFQGIRRGETVDVEVRHGTI